MFNVLAAKKIGAGLATIGLAGVGAGIGIVFGAFLGALSRTPGLRDELFGFTVLGFALTEATGIFALMMAFLILFGLIMLVYSRVGGRSVVAHVAPIVGWVVLCRLVIAMLIAVCAVIGLDCSIIADAYAAESAVAEDAVQPAHDGDAQPLAKTAGWRGWLPWFVAAVAVTAVTVAVYCAISAYTPGGGGGGAAAAAATLPEGGDIIETINAAVNAILNSNNITTPLPNGVYKFTVHSVHVMSVVGGVVIQSDVASLETEFRELFT